MTHVVRPCRFLALLWVGALSAAACAGSPDAHTSPGATSPLPKREEMVRHHMQLHFGDLEHVQQLLLEGNLAQAKEFAFLITMPETDPRLGAWTEQLRAVSEAARELRQAPDVNEAFRREVHVAAACARCHVDAGRPQIFLAPPLAPLDDGTMAGRMRRHAWATQRLWEGVIAPSNDRWAAGLEVLASTPLVSSPSNLPSNPPSNDLAKVLQDRARTELARIPAVSIDQRATAYGELLVTCAGCHTALNIQTGVGKTTPAGT